MTDFKGELHNQQHLNPNSPSQSTLLSMRPVQAVLIAALIVAVLGLTMIVFGFVPHVSLLLVVIGLMGYGLMRNISFDAMQDKMIGGVSMGMGAIYLFSFIGLLVASLMMAGTIPTMIYYGFGVISPEMFYLSAFLLSSVFGIALGSGFTTCATIGVAFLGMAAAFGANPAIVAGAVVSGALFGDKMSPLSDTTSIAASIVGIDLFDHIKNMMYTTIPAWLMTGAIFVFLGGSGGGTDLTGVAILKSQLLATNLVHGVALLPLAVLVVLALLRVNAIYTISATIITAIALTFIHSSPSVSDIGGWLFSGYKPAEDLALGDVASIISRGGLQSMFFSQILVILALSLGGLLQGMGILPALLDGMRHLLTKASRGVAAAAFTSLGINVLVGEQYLSLLLSGNAFLPEYQRLGLHPKNLSRTIEDAGTVINPLVPWGVYGGFLTGVFQMPVIDYLPYAFFCYLCFLLTLLFGWTGFTLTRIKPVV